MQRRDFLGVLSGVAAWSFAASAQERDRVRRIAVFASLSADDPEWQTRLAAFFQALQTTGWTVGRNIRIEYSLGPANDAQLRKRATELLALAPDVILANGTSTVQPLMDATRSVPIVFMNVTDPVGAGYVASLARPGGNVTGFAQFEYGMSGKWLDLLKQVSPSLKRVSVLRDPTTPTGIAQLASIISAGQLLGVTVNPIDVRSPAEIERGVKVLAGTDGGLILSSGASSIRNREVILAQTARHRVPAVYPFRIFASTGGLMSYGATPRTLRGVQPAISTASSTARSRPTSPCNSQTSTNS